MNSFNPGDMIRFRKQGDAAEHTVIVRRHLSDESAGMADETEFFVNSSLEVSPAKSSGPEEVQCILLATDGKAYLEGQPITIESSR